MHRINLIHKHNTHTQSGATSTWYLLYSCISETVLSLLYSSIYNVWSYCSVNVVRYPIHIIRSSSNVAGDPIHIIRSSSNVAGDPIHIIRSSSNVAGDSIQTVCLELDNFYCISITVWHVCLLTVGYIVFKQTFVLATYII